MHVEKGTGIGSPLKLLLAHPAIETTISIDELEIQLNVIDGRILRTDEFSQDGFIWVIDDLE